MVNKQGRFSGPWLDVCWEWTGYTMTNGYGTVHRRPGKHLVHRYAYELLIGPIPARLVIDHLCRVRHCVNPDHLEPVPQRENLRRGVGVPPANPLKTHCFRGHRYDEDNTYLARRGSRACRACHAIIEQDRRQRIAARM
jgi:hypothetical protein